MVTPFYWGSHWPLARGKTTGWAIDDRIGFSPCHNSIVSWYKNRPTPLREAHLETLDTLGRSRTMIRQTWAWLIGMSDANDERLLQWAHSFFIPPSLEVQGARLDAESYVPERRAIRLDVEDTTVVITLKPLTACVNPVFELIDSPKTLAGVWLADSSLDPKDYAWDGKTLWLNRTITKCVVLRLEFAEKQANRNPEL